MFQIHLKEIRPRNRTDPDEVNINVTNATNCVKLVFPGVKKKVYAQFYVERER